MTYLKHYLWPFWWAAYPSLAPLGPWVLIAAGVIRALLIAEVLSRPRRDKRTCRHCGQDLRGVSVDLATACCPKCGLAFASPQKFARSQSPPARCLSPGGDHPTIHAADRDAAPDLAT